MIAQFAGLAWRLAASLVMLTVLAVVSLGRSEPVLNAQTLEDMEVHSVWAGRDTIRLKSGEYRETTGAGSMSEISVRLTGQVAFGEINGKTAAAAVLITDPGPSDILYRFLVVVVEQEGTLVNVDSTFLGPWVQVDSIAIEGDRIILDMVVHGPDDPLCCPTQRVLQTYALQGG